MACGHEYADEHTPLVRPNGVLSTSSCSNLAERSQVTNKSTKRKLTIATTIALMFFATELVAGYFANSLALMSDAFHLLSDVASFIVALAAIYLAEKPPTKKHTYGFHRAEVISALVSVLTIWVLTGFLVLEAIERIRAPQVIDARLDVNINLRAAALHVIGDLLASIGVLISSIILIFKPEYTIVDPICTFVFSIIVLYTTYYLVKDSIAVLMEGAPGHIQPESVENSLLKIPGVTAVHDLHIWTLSPGKSSLTAHITVSHEKKKYYDDILAHSQQVICDTYGIHHSTLQIESEKANFTSHCRPDMCSPRN
ncbi:hypothetical protein CU098_010572 [Rhizopus stolonifer]|uniref:Uncharacterized protein n=1 Tax=Rhizopus stolonifer TaxID=4846 RepID=A0A367KWG4_RHIST|nr:hypothetical protein CU098_010572 [Rhizopus stolonifer]